MSGEKPILGPLLDTKQSLDSEARKRNDRYDRISVSKKLEEDYLADGWEPDKPLKYKVKLRRPKSVDELLENQVWRLMYLLGYHEMNKGRNFEIQVKRPKSDPLRKQIDVFAKDDETVIVAECKASGTLSKRSLQKDLEEFGSLKGDLAKSIQKHYGKEFKPKIVWMFFTRNIIWSRPDRERASGLRIRVVTEKQLGYYLQIADHLKGAARYQFLATFLQGEKIPELANRTVPAIRGKLGGRKFYCFVTTPRSLLKIAFINHRSLEDPDGAPSYQRLVSRTRMRQIGTFLQEGGFFPTNILLNFCDPVRFDPISSDKINGVAYGHMYLPDKYRSAWVIDGQHRLYGFAQLDEEDQDQNIIALAFERMSKEQEANLFVTINHEQKTVSKSLLDDLKGELKWESEIPSERIAAISARLIRLLDQDVGEPFYGRVTRQGITGTEVVCLTMPALVQGLRRSGLLGKAAFNNKEFQPGPLSGLNDSESLERARVALNGFFETIKSNREKSWAVGRPGHLCTNIAVQGYLRLFAALIDYMEGETGLTARELEPLEILAEIEEYLDPVLKWLSSASPSAMERRFKVQFGSGGPNEYFFRLVQLVKDVHSDFTPEGTYEWEQERSEERIEAADRKLKELNILVQKSIFDRLRQKYGAEDSAYWEEGVDQKTRADAYARSLDDELKARVHPENYLFFHEYKKIVEKKGHWDLFKDLFDIQVAGDKKLGKNIQWMDRINGLRRIPAHATQERVYKLEDLDYIDFIHSEFSSRVASAEDEAGQASSEPD